MHLRGARALAANGHVTTDLPESVVPEIAGNVALAEAIQLIAVEQPENAADARYSEPRLGSSIARSSRRPCHMARALPGSSKPPVSHCVNTSGWTRNRSRAAQLQPV